MVGNAAHGLPVTAGKGKIQQGGYFQGILGKHFVEISQPEEKNFPLMIPFYPPVLIEHRRRSVLIRNSSEEGFSMPLPLSRTRTAQGSGGT
jgi:hypothetical protein